MNKWILMVALQSCVLAQASYKDEQKVEAEILRDMNAVSAGFTLKSPCADLIAIATANDLEKARFIINEDLYFKNSVGSVDRYLIFFKTMVAQMAQNPGYYTLEAIAARVGLRSRGSLCDGAF